MSTPSIIQSFRSLEISSKGLLTTTLLDFSCALNKTLIRRIDELSTFFENAETSILTMCRRRIVYLTTVDYHNPDTQRIILAIYNMILCDLDFSLNYAAKYKLLPVLDKLILSDPCISSVFYGSTNYSLGVALSTPAILDDLDMLFNLLDKFKDMLLDGATAQILGYALLNAIANNNLPNIERLLSKNKDEIDKKMLKKALLFTKPALQNVCFAKTGEKIYTKGRPEALEIFRANCPEFLYG